MESDKIISLSQAAQLLGYHPNYLGELARQGRLRAQRLGSFWVTTQSEVSRLRKKKNGKRSSKL